MVDDVVVNNNDNNNKSSTTITKTKKPRRKTKSSTTTTTLSNNPLTNLERYTKGISKNKSLKILDNVKIHNYWNNIFRRKLQMHEYFSESAFGSQSDTKIEYRNLSEDPEYIKKYNLSATKYNEDDEDIPTF